MKKEYIYILIVVMVIFSCHRRRTYEESYQNNTEIAVDDRKSGNEEYREERSIRKGTKVHMEQAGGVYIVPIIVNGLDLKFIFDTGASSICISAAEAAVMVRQGKITEEDILGQQQFKDATGEISVGTIIRLHTVEIGGIVLHNVEANVVDNIQAPLLLGQTALSKFGKVTIDYNSNIIEFN